MSAVVARKESIPNNHPLIDKWNLYCHLPFDKDWTMASYKLIMENIDSVEKLCALNETIPEEMVKSSMLYVMRNGINPIWEDPFNCDGGAFSFRLSKVGVHFVWKNLFYLLCGETLCIDRKYNALINGITISPKKEFCILKIWMRDRTVHDPNIFVDIKDLPKTGCLFKKHGPDM